MSSDQPDVVSFQPRTPSRRSAWAAVVILAAALVAALAFAVHYYNQAGSLQHQLSGAESRLSAAATAPVASAASGLPVTDTRVVLLGPDSLAAEVTFASASSPARQDYLTLTATITGGRPHTRYTLVWGSCAGNFAQQSATGLTDAGGHAELTGRVSRAALEGSYQLLLIPGNRDLQSLAIYGSWSQPVPGQPQIVLNSGGC
jgi:hypothetical protein